MGNSFNPRNFPVTPLAPLPGQGSKDPSHARDIDDTAVSREASENLIEWLNATRDIGDRGHHQYSLRLLAEKLAKSASSDVDLGNRLRDHLNRKKHPQVHNEKDAEFLIRLAFEIFSKMHHKTDSDLVWYWTAGLLEEYKGGVKISRRERIGVKVKQIEKSPLDRSRVLWNKRVQRLAAEANVSFKFAAVLLREYERLTGLPVPTVDPRLYPAIQGAVSAQRNLFATTTVVTIGVPLSAMTLPALIAQPLLAWKLFIHTIVVVDLVNAIKGRDIITGSKLETWERFLSVAIALIPQVKYASVLRVGAKLSKKGVKSAQFIAKMAVESGRGLVATARFAKRLGEISMGDLSRFRLRVLKAIRTNDKSLTLTKLEQTFVKELNHAVRQFERGAQSDGGRSLFGLFGGKASPPSGPISETLRSLARRNFRSRWFRFKLRLDNLISRRKGVDWEKLKEMIETAEFREYANSLQALRSGGYAGIQEGRLVLGMGRMVRRIPFLKNSAIQHELVHVYQELTKNVLTREAAGLASKLALLGWEVHASVLGGPLIFISFGAIIAVIGIGVGTGARYIYVYAVDE